MTAWSEAMQAGVQGDAASRERASEKVRGLLVAVEQVTPEELPTLAPLLHYSVDVELRKQVADRFDTMLGDGGAELLVAEAERGRASPGYGLADGVDALVFVGTEFNTYGGHRKALRAGLAQRKARIRVLVKKPELKFKAKFLEDVVAGCGLDDLDIRQIGAGLAKNQKSQIAKLKQAMRDPRIVELLEPLTAFARRGAAGNDRSYGEAIFVLSTVAATHDVDAAVFVDALRFHPKTNVEEMALTGLRGLAKRAQAKGDSAALAALREKLAGLAALELLAPMLESPKA
jgi:hypothetical protein